MRTPPACTVRIAAAPSSPRPHRRCRARRSPAERLQLRSTESSTKSPAWRISSAARSRSTQPSGKRRPPRGMCVSEMTAICTVSSPCFPVTPVSPRARSSGDRAFASGAKGRRFKSCRARSKVPENASGFSERPAWTWLALVAAAPSPRRHSRRGCSPHDPAATRGRTMPVPSGTQRCTARATIDLLVARRRAADGRQRRPTSALALLRATCGRRTARSAGLTAWNSIR